MKNRRGPTVNTSQIIKRGITGNSKTMTQHRLWTWKQQKALLSLPTKTTVASASLGIFARSFRDLAAA